VSPHQKPNINANHDAGHSHSTILSIQPNPYPSGSAIVDHHPSHRKRIIIIMPPNRKGSLSDHHHGILTSHRFASTTLQTTVTAKDAVVSSTCPSRPTVDESYWYWSSPLASASYDGDDEQPKPKKKDLFSANHVVANLVREASRKEEEEEEQQQGDEEVEKQALTTDAPDYWNWNVPPHQPPTPPKTIDDRWTSGLAIERNLVRDHHHHHHHPAGSATTTPNQQQRRRQEQQQENLPAPNDGMWDWPTFPRHAAELLFSVAHYERQLLFDAVAAARSSPTTTTNHHQHPTHSVDDDYWRGM
jgi:hypothetical protein